MYRKQGFGGDVGAFDATAEIGRYVRDVIRPRFVVMVSAHWQSESNDTVQVAVPSKSDENRLIYDFYGFPKHMYDEKFRTRNDLSISKQIATDLNLFFSQQGAGPNVTASLAHRGIDHGVWVPLKVAFPEESPGAWNLDCPLIQVSLTANETDFDTHFKLGQALSKYRSEGGLVLVSGMSVHNLHDFMKASQSGGSLPYVGLFNDLIRSILLQDSSAAEKLTEFKALLTDPVKRQVLMEAHPTVEHFVPLIVGLGASAGGEIKELYNNNDGSMGWGIYQFGEL